MPPLYMHKPVDEQMYVLDAKKYLACLESLSAGLVSIITLLYQSIQEWLTSASIVSALKEIVPKRNIELVIAEFSFSKC